MLKEEMRLLKLNKCKNGLTVGYQMSQAISEYIEKHELNKLLKNE